MTWESSRIRNGVLPSRHATGHRAGADGVHVRSESDQ